MRVPRLLIVSHNFPPSSATVARRPARLARFLAAHGQAPAIVTAAPAFYGAAAEGDASAREGLRVCEVPRLRRHALLETAGAPGRQALKASLVLGYRAAIERALTSAAPFDFMYFCGAPFWYFPLARRLGARHGIPYILDFEDVWFMGGLAYRMGRRGKVRGIFDRFAESRCIARASLVILTTESQTTIYRQRYPALPGQTFETIRWGYDAEALGRAQLEQPGFGDLFRLAIFGKFAGYGADDARALARAVGIFHARQRVEVVHLGEREAALESAFRAEGLSGCFKALGMRPYEEGLRALASAHCFALNAISDVSLPAKVYDYIGVNRPVLAFVAPESETARLLTRFPGAFTARTADQAAGALRSIADGRIASLEPGLDTAEFSQERQFERLLERLSGLTEGRASAAPAGGGA